MSPYFFPKYYWDAYLGSYLTSIFKMFTAESSITDVWEDSKYTAVLAHHLTLK